MDIRVYAEPALLMEGCLTGTTAVVIDALRMTSVAATAVEHGCTGLMAVAEVNAARALARETGALVGGERNALPIKGFDFDNSPLAYTRERVGGRQLIMTTSNGTRAILASESAQRIVLGAFVNASAVARTVRRSERLAIVCAGTLGAFTLEDALAAGAILERLRALGADMRLDDMGIAVSMLYDSAQADLHGALRQTVHYQRLEWIGAQADLAYCMTLDAVSAVPELREDGWFA
ncbi:2-phosphosulfolactate phosphatase [Eubacteriales bacterium OttesenSCG-928-A19]|nr:2-phosphosulfolactate phosphatase [Eubacteriales bacterium OttesenSCG-928-A19]